MAAASELTPDQLTEVDAALDRALASGSAASLEVIGFGEISVAIAWPPTEPALAVKLATCQPGQAAVDDHAALLDDYRRALADRGVATVATVVQCAPSGRGYLVQPLLEAATIGQQVVAADPSRAEPVLAAVVERVAGAVDATVGVDPQLANWVVDGDEVVLLDVGSPMLRDSSGRDRIDLVPYLRSVPAAIRPLVRRLGPEILATYHDRRAALTDLGLNLIKVGLEQHCRLVTELTAGHLDEPLTVTEIQRAYRRDARLWQALQAARRADRLWQRHVRRRPYPYLLPPPIDRRLGRGYRQPG